MHTTRVVTKDGNEFEGVLWTCRPEEGWFTMQDVVGVQMDDAEMRFWLRDVASLVTAGERVGVRPDGSPVIGDDDVLARWRAQGRWGGD